MVTSSVVSQSYEQILVEILRALPPNRAEQLVDFARFLEAQRLDEELSESETAAEIEADNTRWDTLLASDKSQMLLEKIAKEAQIEYRATRQTVNIVYWQDDQQWLGYLQEYPDYWTQGETLAELQEYLQDLYRDLGSGMIPGIRKVEEMVVA